MEVLHLNKASFEKLLAQKDKAFIVDFWAEWCGPCRMLGPVLEEIAANHEDVIVGKINVDDERELAVSYGIDSIPAVFLFRNGKAEKSVRGYMDRKSLEAKLGL